MPRLLSYYLLMALAGVLGMAKGVLLAKLLGVEGFGAFGLAIALGGAFQFAIGLGASEGLSVVLPKYFAEQQGDIAARTVRAAARMIVIRAAVVTALTAPLFIVMGHAYLALAALLGLANALTTIPMVLTRSRGNIHGFGTRMFLKALFSLALAAAGARLAGAPGAVAGEFVGLMAAAMATWGWRRNEVRLPLHDAPAVDRELRSNGKPLLMQSVNTIAQQNIERWAVAATLGLTGVGKYNLVQLLTTAVNLVHSTFYQQAGSRILPRMAGGESPYRTQRQLLLFAGGLGLATLSVAAGAAPFANVLLNLVFPSFGDFTWGIVWLGGAAVAQMLHHSDWILIGRSQQHLIERIAWLSTALTLVLCACGFVFRLSLEFFLFSYFVGRLFVLFATFGAAWTKAPPSTVI